MRQTLVRTLTIRMKLIVLFVMLFLLPFLVLAALWHTKSAQSIEENAIQSTDQLVMQINRNVDYYFTDIKKWTAPLLTNPIVQKFIKLGPTETYNQFVVSEEMKLDLFPNYVYGRNDIIGFTLLSVKGIHYTNTTIQDRIEKFRELETGEENYLILGVSIQNSIPILTVYRKIVDNKSFLMGGAIIVDLHLDTIMDIIGDVQLGDHGIISIVDSSGAYLYHPDHSLWGQRLPVSYSDEIGGNERANFVIGSGQNKKIVITNRSKLTGLTLISEVPLKGLMQELVGIRNLTILLGGAILLLAIFLFLGLSFSINKPLHDLIQLMKKAELGNLLIRAPVRKDEFGRLNEGFNRMISEIQRLIEIVHFSEMRQKEMAIKQRESLLQSLQSRINPHFLYNTLETINAYAIVAQFTPIRNMTVWLSQILRYSIGNTDKLIPLGDEMNNVFAYFNIQRERFRDLRVEVQLDPQWLEKVRILPLTIQPIVENVFSHGFEKRKPDYIGIIASNEDRYFSLCIIDKGKGMTEELVNAYNHAFEHLTDQDMMKPDFQPFPRLGLWNVHSRLRLAFGKPFGLNIVRSSSEGTAILIMLPYSS